MTAPTPGSGGEETSLEQAVERLEEIARSLEGGDLELADSLALYEEGIRLLRTCEGLIGAAEERLQQLRADGESFRLDPLGERS